MPAAIVLAALAAAGVSWNQVTLGAPVSTLRPLLGDPLRIVTSRDGTTRIGRYWIPGNDSTYFLVLESRGYVDGFDAFTEERPLSLLTNVAPDPLGVRLGEALEDVTAARHDFVPRTDDDGNPMLVGHVSLDVTALYTFASGRLASFHWIYAVPATLPELPALTEPSGAGVATAISDGMTDEMSGVAWEYRYIAFHPCSDKTRWVTQSQALVKEGNQFYDRIHAVCPTTKAERDFYFDINRYFGKM